MTLTSRSRRWSPRADLDRNAVRHFIYRLHDANGVVLYVGRSCNVAQRIRGHVSEACHESPKAIRKALWLGDVRGVTMFGPFSWDDAVREERAEIERLTPYGNLQFVAVRSLATRAAA